jgi:hypothetical protein
VTPYLVPPTIPAGQTVAEYKRARGSMFPKRNIRGVRQALFPWRNK